MASEFRKLMVCLGAMLTLLVVGPHLQAQVVGGTISGNVTDNSGAVLPNATVVMINVATGVNTTVTTNTQGLYSAPNLLPGTYQQKVSASGFETAVRNGGIPGTCANLLGGIGRNSLVGPGLLNLDMSLLKKNYVRRVSEAFNIHPSSSNQASAKPFAQ